MIDKGPDRSRLSALPRRMDDEICFLIDKRHQVAQPFLRRKHVMLAGNAGAGGIESAFWKSHADKIACRDNEGQSIGVTAAAAAGHSRSIGLR
jgi:hypothetical protein